ncbi:MAG TPA: 16S rRNA (adenine(1518)-N(6)/adenine(1519)-N(6))-dimethyltransferase RsmA [Dehalococcoidia bacterium]|nr:16S rRNA (adenine(1518)-N(6)/adenine(1519)-N(6))-dimethyltransferase RsmA [Dehalococcoidia bacterium]
MKASRRRRALGQHWLVSPRYLERIAAAVGLGPDDTVVEVGPGTGNLTRRLLRHASRLVAVEVDETLAEALPSRLGEPANLVVVAGDVLRMPPAELLALAGGGPPYVVVGNLPFSVGTAVVRHFLRAQPPPRRLVVTLQREVAEAVAAPPGRMTFLSVEMQLLAEPQLLFIVPPGAFRPPPKVYSGVVRLDVRDGPAVAVDDVDSFLETVKAGFAAPRKQLRNSLAIGMSLAPQQAAEIIARAGLDPERRPGTLDLEEWARLHASVVACGAPART